MMLILGRVLDLVACPRLGVEVTNTTIRAVMTVRRRITNTARVNLDGVESLEAAVLNLLESTCREIWRKPRVCAAIGPSLSQVRRLGKLPPVKNARVLRELIRSGAGRFFLKNGVPLLTSSVSREHDGVSWAAALDAPPVRALSEACRTRRLRLELAAPAVIALQYGLTDAVLRVEDGQVAVEAHLCADGALGEVRRFLREAEPEKIVATPVDELRLLPDCGVEYAAAYGATAIERREPLAIHGRELCQSHDLRVPRWRWVMAVAALFISIAIALTGPSLRAKRVAARAAAQLALINPKYREAHWTEAELQRTNASLDEIDAFQSSVRSPLAFLSDLTAVLPQDVWLQGLQIDQKGGTLTAFAPRAALAIEAISEIKSIMSPTIVGGVSTEQLGKDRIERVTIQFRWKGPVRGAVRAGAAGGLRP